MKSRIHQGKVTHARRSPVEHRFAFPFYFYAIDLDELPELERAVRGFGHNHWSPVCLRDQDYLRGPGGFRERLAQYVDLAEVDRIVLVTMARFMTKVFNPVNFYYCLKADGSAAAMVAEVNNTFGERHLYVMQEPGPFPIRVGRDKQFHVSPFNDMNGHYAFTFSAPREALRIDIQLIREGEVVMEAALWGEGKELTTAHLWRTVLRHPLTAALTMPRILWQAAVLHYKKKMPVFHKPAPMSPMTMKAKT